jgi:hypothetical protein
MAHWDFPCPRLSGSWAPKPNMPLCTVASRLEWTFAAGTFDVHRAIVETDTPTKRKRRPKSDKRLDYPARPMAAIKQYSDAEKLSESHAVVPKIA